MGQGRFSNAIKGFGGNSSLPPQLPPKLFADVGRPSCPTLVTIKC